MSEEAIRATLVSRLDTWAQAHGLPVEHENESFTPPDGPYLRVTLIPAQLIDDSLSGDHQIYTGILQIDVSIPAGLGPGPIDEIVRPLRLLFPDGESYPLPGLILRQITPLQKGPGFVDGTRYTVPTRLTYRADTVI